MGNIIGRSNRVRQAKVLVEIGTALLLLRKARNSSVFARVNAFLSQFYPWQVVLGTLTATHLLANLSLLLGLNAPSNSLFLPPDVNYSKNFASVRWMLTALDAGFMSSMKIQIPVLRDVMSILLGIYYLIFSRQAEIKVAAFQKNVTIEVGVVAESGCSQALTSCSNARRPSAPAGRKASTRWSSCSTACRGRGCRSSASRSRSSGRVKRAQCSATCSTASRASSSSVLPFPLRVHVLSC